MIYDIKMKYISKKNTLKNRLANYSSSISILTRFFIFSQQSICPGLVETEITQQWLKENSRLALKPKDVADAILYSLQIPENVLIKNLIITHSGDYLNQHRMSTMNIVVFRAHFMWQIK